MSVDLSSTERLDTTIPGAFPDTNASQTAITTHQTLSQALFARRAEYTRPRSVRIKVGTWNVAAQKGTEQDVGAWFVGGQGIEESLAGLGIKSLNTGEATSRETVPAQEARHTPDAPTVPHDDPGFAPGEGEVGIYVLGLQEIVDIASPAEALRPYTDPTTANRWKASVEQALPTGYQLVAEQQLIGLLLLVYASPNVHPHIKAVSATSVGTGLMGYMGNKGAVTTRIVLGETTRLVFINSHLAAGADKTALERRNWDAGQITSRTRFDPITDAMSLTQANGEGLGEEDFAFWFGDLNYRLEGMPGEDVRRLLSVHTRQLDPDLMDDPNNNASASPDSGYASKSSSDSANNGDANDFVPLPPELDPGSLHTTINSLLPHDELKQQQKAGKAFHDGWEEGPIRFLPSYKYDIGKVAVFDSSDKQRCPSWCDRILYRTRASKQRHDAKMKERDEANRRDEEMKATGLDRAGAEDEVLYDYDPETDGDNRDTYDEYDENDEPEPETVITKEGFSDEILLETYTAHMRVLSSDHKPLEAVFSLNYDAVIPELKAAIHQEVARELDRQENEGRPSVAVVVDRSTGTASLENKDTTDSTFDGVDFGDVQFAKTKRRNITIANTGRVPATFGFTDRPVEKDQPEGPFPPWLSITFDRQPDASAASSDDLHQQFTLQPAEVCNGELKLKVQDLETVRKLNEGSATLDEILVLRVQDGRDHFLPLHAHWLQSALSRTVDKLIKIPEGGIRKLQHQTPDRGDGVKWSVPREIFRLTEAIEVLTERTLAEWDMMGHEGDKEKPPWQHNAAWPFIRQEGASPNEDVVADVYDALDCDEPFDRAFPAETPPKQRLELLADSLLLFLHSLQDGVVTKSLWEKLEEGITTRERLKQHLPPDDEKIWALEILSSTPNHLASFLLIVSMLQNVRNQIAEASKTEKPTTPRSSIDVHLPASPKVSVRRKTLSKVPEVAIRQLINRNYAVSFVDVMFRAPNLEKLKEKDKTAKKERMAKIVELFLNDGE